jgi:ribonuclease HII
MGNRVYVPDGAIAITDKSHKISSVWFKALLEGIDHMNDTLTIGIDEVGVGSWFGPMVVVGTANLTGWHIDGIKDSKKIKSEKVRQALASEIQHNCLWVAATMSAEAVDKFGTHELLKHANRRIARALVAKIRENLPYPQPAIRVVIDGGGDNWTEDGVRYQSIPQADASVFEVSAASIVAKVICDNWIHDAVKASPGLAEYDLDSNKGYGTAAHIAGLQRLGLTPHHRARMCAKYAGPTRRLA